MPCLVLTWLSSSCLALPCLALPCLALPCLALPCLALPCLALPCLALLSGGHPPPPTPLPLTSSLAGTCKLLYLQVRGHQPLDAPESAADHGAHPVALLLRPARDQRAHKPDADHAQARGTAQQKLHGAHCGESGRDSLSYQCRSVFINNFKVTSAVRSRTLSNFIFAT